MRRTAERLRRDLRRRRPQRHRGLRRRRPAARRRLQRHLQRSRPAGPASDEPSDCNPICGDGLIRAGEQCDDHNLTLGDGCNSRLRRRAGLRLRRSAERLHAVHRHHHVADPRHLHDRELDRRDRHGQQPARRRKAQLTVNGVSVPVGGGRRVLAPRCSLSATDDLQPDPRPRRRHRATAAPPTPASSSSAAPRSPTAPLSRRASACASRTPASIPSSR